MNGAVKVNSDFLPLTQRNPQMPATTMLPGPSQASHPSAPLPVRQIEGDVLAVLRQCHLEGTQLRLPAGQLERKLYEKTNAVLVSMGGKWKGGKVQAHVFDQADPLGFAQCFEALQASGVYTDPKDLGFFQTQEPQASQAIECAGLRPGMRVLEPSAGRGALARPAAAIVGLANVHCIELFPPNARVLQEMGFAVQAQDFLATAAPLREQDRYDVVLMNPPFGALQDIAHVSHACHFLKSTGRLVAITSPSWESRASRRADAFRELLLGSQARVTPIAAGAFKAAGTMVATRMVVIEAKHLPWHRSGPADTAQGGQDALLLSHEHDDGHDEEHDAATAPAPCAG